jgi:L-histidine N-alpha-methyltransferase
VVLATSERVLMTVYNGAGRAARDRDELRAALQRSPREIPSRFFYDDRGSRLFERITELPEYYQTRTEHALLRAIADRVAAVSRAAQLIEIGSGAATKTRVLLDAMERAGRLQLYVPVDVAEGTVRRVAEELTAEYPELAVHGIVADFTEDLSLLRLGPECADRRDGPASFTGDTVGAAGTGTPPGFAGGPASFTGGAAGAGNGAGCRLVIFLGGTIGNLEPREAAEFLAIRRREMAPGDHFLLGVDLVKPVAVVEAAYNDDAGVTAEFNRNILRVANQVAGGDFEPEAFSHRAFYDCAQRWIEMRLRSDRRQHVRLPGIGLELDLEPGEEIHTEISVKYDRPRAEGLLAGAGFEPVAWYTDADQLFGLALARIP